MRFHTRRYLACVAIVILVLILLLLYAFKAGGRVLYRSHIPWGKKTDIIDDVLQSNSEQGAVFYNEKYSIDGSHVDVRRLTAAEVERLLQSTYAVGLSRRYAINVVLSDLIPLNRQIPDSRPQGCSRLQYPDKLPSTSIVIPFHNEWPSILLRTVHSIVNRTPIDLLKEIVLVDDASDEDYLYRDLENRLLSSFPSGIVKLIHLKERSGLITARLEGLKHVTADVVSFFDCHMEVNENWLPPLLNEIVQDRKTVAMAQLDYINRGNFVYEFEEGYRTRYGFDWRLVFFETYFTAKQLEGKQDTDPLPGVVMVGPAFVVDVKYFKELGTYDDQMRIWGGENLEFPWRVWLCGGRLVHVPCSRIGHIARQQPYSFPGGREKTEMYNYKRAVEVWMDDYKHYVYDTNPGMKAVDVGDLSERLAVKERLQCKPFKWFMDTVWPDLLPYSHHTLAWGKVENKKSGLCLDTDGFLFSVRSYLLVRPCSTIDSSDRQTFAVTQQFQLRSLLQCVKVNGSFLIDKIPVLEGCFETNSEQWQHAKDGLLRHIGSGLCLEMLSGNNALVMSRCDDSKPSQRWSFTHYT